MHFGLIENRFIDELKNRVELRIAHDAHELGDRAQRTIRIQALHELPCVRSADARAGQLKIGALRIQSSITRVARKFLVLFFAAEPRGRATGQQKERR